MIILGVDPGTNITGFGIIKQESSGFNFINNDLIKLPPKYSLSQKLVTIYDELIKIINRYKPDQFDNETASYGKKGQSAKKNGYARGAAILAAVHCTIPMSEYSPREFKKFVVGQVPASKELVAN